MTDDDPLYDQAPVPLTIFRSNSKLVQNVTCFEMFSTITTIFCTRPNSVNVVTCTEFRCDRLSIFSIRALHFFLSNFEFDRNTVNGTGSRGPSQ